MARLHSKLNVDEFPAACDICEKVLENEIAMKKTQEKRTYLSFCKILLQWMGVQGECPWIKEHTLNEHRENAPEHYPFSYWSIHSKDISDIEIRKQSPTIYRVIRGNW